LCVGDFCSVRSNVDQQWHMANRLPSITARGARQPSASLWPAETEIHMITMCGASRVDERLHAQGLRCCVHTACLLRCCVCGSGASTVRRSVLDTTYCKTRRQRLIHLSARGVHYHGHVWGPAGCEVRRRTQVSPSRRDRGGMWLAPCGVFEPHRPCTTQQAQRLLLVDCPLGGRELMWQQLDHLAAHLGLLLHAVDLVALEVFVYDLILLEPGGDCVGRR